MTQQLATCVMVFLATIAFGTVDARKDSAITAVAGESWLHHLSRSFDETSMGKTWRLGPPNLATDQSAMVFQSRSSSSSSSSSRAQLRTLRGSDLYRMNCEGCHGVSGLGAAPEIASLIDPVRATSAALIRERMKKIGTGISRRDAAELANQARGALIKRLHEGGHDMPPFQHLTKSEIRSLVAYLRQLAKVPGADGEQVAIQESNVRIGELIVKSTCHICHGATGKNPNLAELSEGAIPPLSALPARVTETQLERKVTSGSPVITDEMSAIFRGRMPVFSYLAENEAADVYEYLTQYPPTELPSTDQSAMQTRAQQRPGDQGVGAEGYRTNSAPPELYRVKSLPELGATVALPISAGLFAIALFVLGGWITVREFRKISVASPERSSKSPKITATPLVRLSPPVELVRHRAGERTDPPESKTSPHLEERKIS